MMLVKSSEISGAHDEKSMTHIQNLSPQAYLFHMEPENACVGTESRKTPVFSPSPNSNWGSMLVSQPPQPYGCFRK